MLKASLNGLDDIENNKKNILLCGTGQIFCYGNATKL